MCECDAWLHMWINLQVKYSWWYKSDEKVSGHPGRSPWVDSPSQHTPYTHVYCPQITFLPLDHFIFALGSKRLFSVSDQHKVRLSIARHTPTGTSAPAPLVCAVCFNSCFNFLKLQEKLTWYSMFKINCKISPSKYFFVLLILFCLTSRSRHIIRDVF